MREICSGKEVTHTWYCDFVRDHSLIYFKCFDHPFRFILRTMRIEQKGGPNIFRIEKLIPLVTGASVHIVATGIYRTRAGTRERRGSHGFPLRKAPFINAINRIAPLATFLTWRIRHYHYSLGRHALCFSSTTVPRLLQPYFFVRLSIKVHRETPGHVNGVDYMTRL